MAYLRGGLALDKLKLEDSDEQTGVNILKRALEEPMRQIAQNAGHEGAIVLAEVRKSKNANFGFNAESEEYEDLFAAGVVDPTMVTRTALQNAASIAGLLLTTEALITEVPEDEKAPAGHAPDMGGMGGMGGMM